MAKKAAEPSDNGHDVRADRTVRDETVIRMYQEGFKLAEITRDTHVPRATIFLILKRHGIPTDRIAAADRGQHVSTQELLDRLRDTERENGALREKIARLEGIVDYLSVFTQAVRPAGDGASRPSRPRTPTGRQ